MKRFCITSVALVFLALPAVASAAKPQLLTVPSQQTNAQTQTFEFAIALPISFECMIDSGPLAACTSPFVATGLGEGAHTFAVRAIHNVPLENCSPDGMGGTICVPTGVLIPSLSDFASFNFIVDRTAPTVGFEGWPKQGSSTRSRTANIVFDMEGGGSYTCTFDKRTPEPCEAPIEWRNLQTGLHRVNVRGTDAAGNVGAEFSLEFAVNSRSVTYRSITKTRAKRCVRRKLKRRGKVMRTKKGKVRYKTTCKRVKF